jgi:hypothetical protein
MMPVSRITSYVIPGLLALLFVMGSFWLGLAIGERRAQHFGGWCDSYRHAFLPPGRRRISMPMSGLPNPHGVFGRVVSRSGQIIVIQGNDDIDQSVLITSSTAIRIGDRNGTLTDVYPDAQVAVFGMPSPSGQIEAHLVRILTYTR